MFWIVLSGLIVFMIFLNIAFMTFCLIEMKKEED